MIIMLVNSAVLLYSYQWNHQRTYFHGFICRWYILNWAVEVVWTRLTLRTSTSCFDHWRGKLLSCCTWM